MQTQLDSHLAEGYESASQKIRVLTESWVGQEAFCPACGNPIIKAGNNRPALDFYCPRCAEEYELKSSKSRRRGDNNSDSGKI